MAKTREFILFSDSTMANPNGDMIKENRPRCDETTEQLEITDVRMKKYFREEAENQGYKIFVKICKDQKGNRSTCSQRAKNICEKKEILEETLKKDYIDVKLFGAVVTKPTLNIRGALQVAWSKSIHKCDINCAQGSTAFASDNNKEVGSIWEKYYTPYALFKTYMVYNDKVAEKQGIDISEEEIEIFKSILLSGIKKYRSTSKNHMPRILLEVIYNENYIDGELDYIDVSFEKEDLELRDIKDFEFDFCKLNDYYNSNKEKIECINIYIHSKVIYHNILEEYNIYRL